METFKTTKVKEGTILGPSLEEMSDDRILYIGTEHGSRWMFIATVGELKETLPSESKTALQDLQSDIRAEQTKNKNIQSEISRKKRELNMLERDKEQSDKKLKSMRDYELVWKNFEDREVVEVYPHDSEPYGTSVIICGNETGSFLDYDEKKGRGA